MTEGQRDHFALCGQMATQALGLDDDHNSPDEVRVAIEQFMAIVAKLDPWVKRIESANEELGKTAHVGLYRQGVFRQEISEVTKEMRQAAEAAEQEARTE